MCQFVMGYDKDSFFNYDPNYDGIHLNVKPNVGTISEFPDHHSITNCVQTMDEVLGGVNWIY